MTTHTSAGVYTTEKDLSTRVKSVNTSIMGFAGAAGKGKVGVATLFNTPQDFISMHGSPDPRISLVHYSVLEVLKNSSQVYFTRIINDDSSRGPQALTAGAFYSIDDLAATSPVGSLNVFDDGAGKPKGIFDPFNTYVWNQNVPGIDRIPFLVCMENPGLWNNGIYIQVRSAQKALTDGFDEAYDDPYAFYIDVFLNYVNTRSIPDESFYVTRVDEVGTDGQNLFIEHVINNSSALIRVRNNPYAPAVKVVSTTGVFLDGGSNGKLPSYTQLIKGWQVYADPEVIDVSILVQGGDPVGYGQLQDIADIQSAMIEICETRKDCMAVLDIPSTEQSVARAVAYKRSILNNASNYAAIFTPDLEIKDTYNDRYQFVPPSGFVASRMAYTDTNYAEYFAAAGMTRGALTGIRKGRQIYRQGARDTLNDAQVNAIRYFPTGEGFKIWGADTLQVQSSALTQIPVRRMLLSCEKSISNSLLYALFDPNDRVLRSRIKSELDKFLQPIKDGRGLTWFSVVCDDTNNKSETIAAGILVVDMYVIPTLFAKRIHLRAHITKTGAKFTQTAS